MDVCPPAEALLDIPMWNMKTRKDLVFDEVLSSSAKLIIDK